MELPTRYYDDAASDVNGFERWLHGTIFGVETPEVASILWRYWKLVLSHRMLARHPAQNGDRRGSTTTRQALWIARRLLRFITAQGESLSPIDPRTLDRYFASLAPALRYATQGFARWLVRSGICTSAPPATRIQRRAALPLHLRETLARILDPNADLSHRAAAGFAVFCCMKYSPIASLKTTDITVRGGHMFFRHPVHDRDYPITPVFAPIVAELRRKRNGYLFPRPNTSQPLTGRTIAGHIRLFLPAHVSQLRTALMLELLDGVPARALTDALPVAVITVSRVQVLRGSQAWGAYVDRLYKSVGLG